MLLSINIITQCDNVKTLPYLPINTPLYFYSVETKSYTELIFTEHEIFVYNNIGGINIGLYNQKNKYILRPHESDTIAYFCENAWFFCLEQKNYKLKSVDSLLVSNNFQSGFTMRQSIFRMKYNSEKKDSILYIHSRKLK